MPSCRQIHSEHFVARLQDRIVYGHIGLGTGMRLHIDILGTKELERPIDRQLFRFIHMRAASIVAFAWIAFRIFIC